MDIKLIAHLYAYSKVDSFAASGIASVPEQDIDTLFVNEPVDRTVTKDEIDKLFATEPEEFGTVTKDTIDTLFKTEEKTTTVEKDHIDTLFVPEDEEPTESVSFAEIDSLFS